jgi:hypothetical protein
LLVAQASWLRQDLLQCWQFIFFSPNVNPIEKDKYLRTKAGPCSSSPEPQHSRITAADRFNVPTYWHQCCLLAFLLTVNLFTIFHNEVQLHHTQKF